MVVYEISYLNVPLNKTYKAKTSNPIVAKLFLNQLSANACICTISGGTETIYEYDDPSFDDLINPDALILRSSEIDNTSIYLTDIMYDQAEEFIYSVIMYNVHTIPDLFTYKLMPYTRGSFRKKLVECVIPAMYRVLYDSKDSCLDVVKTLCNAMTILGEGVDYGSLFSVL